MCWASCLEGFGDTQASLGRGGLRPRKAYLGVKGLKPRITKSVKFGILKHRMTSFKSYLVGYQFFTPRTESY